MGALHKVFRLQGIPVGQKRTIKINEIIKMARLPDNLRLYLKRPIDTSQVGMEIYYSRRGS